MGLTYNIYMRYDAFYYDNNTGMKVVSLFRSTYLCISIQSKFWTNNNENVLGVRELVMTQEVYDILGYSTIIYDS